MPDENLELSGLDGDLSAVDIQMDQEEGIEEQGIDIDAMESPRVDIDTSHVARIEPEESKSAV